MVRENNIFFPLGITVLDGCSYLGLDAESQK